MEQTTTSSSTSWRALIGLPFLLATALMLYAFTFAEPIGAALEPMIRSGVFSHNGVEVQMNTAPFGVPVLHDLLGPISTAFMYLIIHAADPRAWWQSLVFLSEFSGVYGMLLLESSRPVYKGSFFRFPFFLAFPGQFICIGILAPIYFYAHYVFNPQYKLLSSPAAALAISQSHAVISVVAVGTAYWAPHFVSYFHADYQARNWWNLMWQVYPVWGSSIFFVASTALSVLNSSSSPAAAAPVADSRGPVRIAVGQLAVVATGAYWYMMYSAEFSFAEIFVPGYLIKSPHTASVALQTILRYDYITSFAGVVLWLLYAFAELKGAKVVNTSWMLIFVMGAISIGVFGLGTTLLIGWLWRDEVLSSKDSGKRMKKP